MTDLSRVVEEASSLCVAAPTRAHRRRSSCRKPSITRRKIRGLALLPVLVVTFLAVPPAPVAAQDEFAALREPVRDLARQILDAEGRKVAVVDFSDLSGRVLEVGRAIAEEVASLLVREGKPLQVVDRLSMAALLKEHQLTVSGLLDTQTTRELGRISGVGVLVTGTITPLSDTIRITLKAIDTETATLLGAATVSMPRSNAIDRLLRLEASGDGEPLTSDAGDYQGTRRFERYKQLDVQLESFQVLNDGEIVAALRLRNSRPDDGGIALAVKAEGSGGLPDFWKFFPQATGYATDSQGNRYRIRSVTGLGYAREQSDWNILRGEDELPVTVSFSGGSRVRREDVFSLAVELWYADKSRKREAVTVTFRNVRPK